jgi:predicted RNA-binding Zn ribbon-like protein
MVVEKRLFDLTLTGQLSLDFANTVDWRTSERPQELINSYADLLRWSRHTGLLTEREARRLAREAELHPAAANKVLDGALQLRETLYRIFSATAQGRHAEANDLRSLNEKLSDALSRLRVGPVPDGYSWQWAETENDLSRMLWPIVRAAGDLLTSGELQMLRQCPGAGCSWLFVDTSRNKSRRWCDMTTCGNRAKARRHYEQAKSA